MTTEPHQPDWITQTTTILLNIENHLLSIAYQLQDIATQMRRKNGDQSE